MLGGAERSDFGQVKSGSLLKLPKRGRGDCSSEPHGELGHVSMFGITKCGALEQARSEPFSISPKSGRVDRSSEPHGELGRVGVLEIVILGFILRLLGSVCVLAWVQAKDIKGFCVELMASA